MTIFRNLLTGEMFAAHQTRNHPASSYGKPVWVRDDNGEAFDQFGIGQIKFLTTTEAASLLGISAARVRRMLKDGILAGRRFGRDWQVEKASVSARLAEREREKKKEAPSPGPPPE